MSPSPRTSLGDAPPPELDAAIGAAWQRANALASAGRELDFTIGAGGGLRIRLRGRAGVIRTVTAGEAVGLMNGLMHV